MKIDKTILNISKIKIDYDLLQVLLTNLNFNTLLVATDLIEKDGQLFREILNKK